MRRGQFQIDAMRSQLSCEAIHYRAQPTDLFGELSNRRKTPLKIGNARVGRRPSEKAHATLGRSRCRQRFNRHPRRLRDRHERRAAWPRVPTLPVANR